MDDVAALLVCLLANERYALPLSLVREVLRWRIPTMVPGTPPTLHGVIHQRGVVLPVVDVRPLLGLATPPPSASTRLVVVDAEGIPAALIADRVEDIFTPTDQPEGMPSALPAEQAQYLSGLARWNDETVALLQVPLLLAAIADRVSG